MGADVGNPARKGVNPHARRSKSRRQAMQALYQWQLNAVDAAELIAQFESDAEAFRGADREYFEELVSRVVADHEALDGHYAPYLDRPLKDLDPVSRAILRLATYELAERLEVPYRVVINEAVNLARKFGPEKSHAYINAVLDRLSRELRRIEHEHASG